MTMVANVKKMGIWQVERGSKSPSLRDTVNANLHPEIKSRKWFCVRHGKQPTVWVPDKQFRTICWSADENGLNSEGLKIELFALEDALSSFENGISYPDEYKQKCPPTGIGVIMTRIEPIVTGGDLDNVRDPSTGWILPGLTWYLMS
jgi:hypothetical protein